MLSLLAACLVAGTSGDVPVSPGPPLVQQATAPSAASRFPVTSAALGASLVSFAVAAAAFAAPPLATFGATGRPSPPVLAGSLALGGGLLCLSESFLVPLAASLAPGGPEVAAARQRGLRRSRWAMLGLGAGTLAVGVGAALEQHRFGAGQLALGLGLALSTLSAVAVAVLEVVGVLASD